MKNNNHPMVARTVGLIMRSTLSKVRLSYSVDGVVRGKARSVEYTSGIVTYAAS